MLFCNFYNEHILLEIKPLSSGLEITEVLGMKLWTMNKRTDYEDKWENLIQVFSGDQAIIAGKPGGTGDRREPSAMKLSCGTHLALVMHSTQEWVPDGRQVGSTFTALVPH